MRILSAITFSLLLVAVAAAQSTSQDLSHLGQSDTSWIVQIDAGSYDRIDSRMVVSLPKDFPRHRAGVLREANRHHSVPFQVDQRFQSMRWIETIPADETRTYRVHFMRPEKQTTLAVAEDDGQSLVLKSGQGGSLQYQYKRMPSPNVTKPFHARSGFLHGVRTPSGRLITDPMPSDHLHQHGIMFAWRNTEFEGRRVNFWEDAARQGRISHHEIVSKQSGTVFSEIDVRLKHVDTTAPDGDKEVLTETWRIQAYNDASLPGQAKEFVWDFESIQKNISDRPLEVTKFHYGGFMIRGAAEWIQSPHQMLTSKGDSQATGNHTRPLWVDMNGRVAGAHVGLTTMGHPSNFRFPQHVRLHPSMPYYCFAPMVAGGFDIAPGDTFVSRFRFIAHDGPLDRRRAVAHWRDWADPPQVTVTQVNQP